MNTPQLSASPIGAPPALPLPDPDGTARLHLSGPVQVHIHVGQAASGVASPAEAQPATSSRRHPVLLALLGLALAGGGYWTGTRTAASPSAADAVAALAADPAPSLPPLPLGMPAAPGEVPQALRQQLARQPVVTPAPGTPGTANAPGGAAPGAGAPSAPTSGPAPARNPFGLGN